MSSPSKSPTRPARPQVIVAGDFDDLNSRRIRFLQEAAKLGSLTVLLRSDETIRRRQKKSPQFPQAERLYFLRAIRWVSDARVATEEFSEDALPPLRGLRPSLWAVEESRDTASKRRFCESHGLAYRIIRDEDLRGFPIVNPETPASPARKKVMVTGCYDWFHSGHVRFFEQASALGDLYVVVGHDANIRLLKGPGRPLFPQEERRYMTASIRFVRQALISSGDGWLDAEPEIRQIKPDVYVVNEDGDVPEKRDYCRQNGIEYVVLQRAPAAGLPKRSSTQLRGF